MNVSRYYFIGLMIVYSLVLMSYPTLRSGEAGQTSPLQKIKNPTPKNRSESRLEVEGNVLQHRNHSTRDGVYFAPRLTHDKIAGIHKDAAFSAHFEGSIYAQPLYFEGALFVVTEENEVASIDALTGKSRWSKKLPASAKRESLKCGNIDPLGITGTPVIDAKAKAIYFDAMTASKDGPPSHLIYSLSIEDGSVKSGWPVDVSAELQKLGITMHAEDHNQRGALLISEGNVYVPYGGHYGDCGDYHGRVVGISLTDPSKVFVFSASGQGAGIWAPGGISTDQGALLVATGNTLGAKTWAQGQALLRLTSDLKFSGEPADYLSPPDWRELDRVDDDLGGTQPLPLPSISRILVLGKNGKAYLADRKNFGGITNGTVSLKISSTPIRTAAAAVPMGADYLVAVPGEGILCPKGQKGDLIGLKVSATGIQVAYCVKQNGRGSPIISMSGKNGENPVLWTLGSEGDDRLRAFDAFTGTPIFSGGGALERVRSVRAADRRAHRVGLAWHHA